MMVSKIILANNVMLGKSPAEILEDANAAICANNREEMFVTVWLGILTISTGKLIAANAGHEYPVLMEQGSEFTLFKDKHGFVIGGMDGMKYKEYELVLTPGAKLFVYTDGVPEATDANEELFGTERMLAALNADTDAAPEQILNNVRGAVDGFVKDAEQFDDLTMLINDIIEKGGKVTLFTRPRRFGKTLALSMLRTFFELEYDREGSPVDNSRYFEGMRIMDAPEKILSMMGQYPVNSS